MMRDLDDKKIGRLRAHTVTVDNREKVNITGVEDVESFNEEEVVLMTEAGYIRLTGVDLHIAKLNLDEGHLVVEGYVQALEYGDAEQQNSKSGGGFFSKMFR